MEGQIWAVVELMGHVRMAGLVTEEEHFGSKVGRIDIPKEEVECKPCAGGGRVLPLENGSTCTECGGKGKVGGGFLTQWFSGQSIYRMTPCTEEVARRVAKTNQPAPISPFEMPKALTHARSEYGDDDDDED
jgi:RecJ-like exonuclease